MKVQPEDEILARISAGEPGAWALFLDTYSSVIFRIVCTIANTYDARMDLFLHVCARLEEDHMRRVRSFRRRPDAPCRFSTFLAVVVKNVAVDFLRSKEGRFRPFRVVEAMDETDRLLFDYHLRDGRSLEETRGLLAGRHGIQLSEAELAKRAERVAGSLSANQRWRLLSRLTARRRSLPLDTVSEAAVGPGLPVPLASDDGDPEQRLRSKTGTRALRDAFEAMPARRRLALTLKYRDGLSNREIATFMAITLSESDNLVRSGVESLRESMRRSGVARPDLDSADFAIPWPRG